MASFSYRGFQKNGLTASGIVSAEDASSADMLLRQQGILVTQLEPLKGGTDTRVKPEAMARLLDDIAVLLDAGYSYTSALTYLASGVGSKPQKEGLEEAARSVSAGKPFSVSLESAGLLNHTFAGLIGVAENLNKTSVALKSVSADIRSKLAFQASIRKALSYPSFLLCALVVVFGIFLFGIFPTIENIYSESDMTLPEIFIVIDFARSAYVGAMTIVVLLPLLLMPRARILLIKQTATAALRLPGTRQLVHLMATRDFLAGLEISVQSGCTVKASFANAERLAGLEDCFYKQISERVLKGQDVSGLEPPHRSLKIVLNLLDVGLKANKLGDCTRQARTYVEQEIRKRTEIITAVAGPAATVLIGVLVGAMAFTMISALSAINNSGLGP